jgi:outer membrane receptor for ferrienterochelin and colicins
LRFAIFIFFQLVLCTVTVAQNQLRLEISSSRDKEVGAYAEVLVSKTKSFTPNDVITYAAANEFGIANLTLQNGLFYAKVVAVGYQDLIQEIRVNASSTYPLFIEPTDEMLGQTVVTVQSRPQSSTKSVEKVLVLSKKELDSRSVFNLKDALTQQMNVQISNDNSTGSSVSLMGVSGQNVKILIDGVPVIGRLDGNIDLSQININDIERIEVIEGPVSTAYGSNALAGVINVITKKKTSTSGELTLDGYHETNGQDNISLVAGKQIKKYNLRVGGSRNFFGGWNPTDGGRYDLWKPKEQYNGRFQISRNGTKTQLLIKSEFFTELLLNKGRPLPSYFETAFDEEFYTKRFDQKIQLTRQLDSNRTFSGYLAYNHYSRVRNKFFKDLVTLQSRQVLTDGGDDTTAFNAIMARGTYNYFAPKKPFNFQLGYDVISQTGIGSRIETGTQTISDFAVFMTSEITIKKKITLKPGVRLAYNTSYDAPIAPTLSARYKHKDYVYRVSYGRGFRAPDLKELYLSFVDVNHNVIGNKDLQAERSHNFQASATGFHKLKGLLIRPSASVFYNDITDKITLAGIQGIEYTYVNLDKFRSTGGNVRLGIAGNKTKVNMGYSTTFVTSYSNSSDGRESSFSYSEFNGNISRTVGHYTFNYFVKYNGPRTVFNINLENGEVTESRINHYVLSDFQMGRSLAKKRVQLNVGVKNVFNVQNVNNELQTGSVHTSAPADLAVGTGRSYFIKSIIRLTK